MKTYVIGHLNPDLDSVVAAVSFSEYSTLMEVENPTPAITGDLNRETKYVFEKFNILPPEKISASDIKPEDKIILVDHNEEGHRLTGINPDQIIGIFDHHKADIDFRFPIEICIMPFGSSNTVCWELFREIKHPIKKELASLMLSAIVSDTVNLQSSTTTHKDREALKDLSVAANIADIQGLAEEIFHAKSDISSLTDEQVIKNDYKIFDLGKKVLISKIETVEQSKLINSRKDGLKKALQLIKDQEKVDYIFLVISDILKINSKLLLPSEQEAILTQTAFGGVVKDDILDIGPRISNKKDIVPFIEAVLNSK